MSLFRLLSILLMLWTTWVMIRSYINKRKWRGEMRENRKLEAGRIVKCQHCEVHLPETEALQHNAQWFCTREHMQAFLARPKS